MIMRKAMFIQLFAAAIIGGGIGAYVSGPHSPFASRPATIEGVAPVSATIAAIPVTGAYGEFPSLAPLVEKVTPAVVNIAVRSTYEASVAGNPLLQDRQFRRFFGIPDELPRQERMSVGSGVIVDGGKGYILTNFHVVDKASEITVTLKDRREFKAKVVGKDQETDIALLQIDADDLTALAVGDSSALHVGDHVLAVGNPFGLGQTVTSGIVSATGRSGLNIEGYEDFIQTDAAINPGNSGGALVNMRGELVGINTAILGPSGGNVGIGFAVPTSMASAVMDQLIKSGKVTRGRIGVAIADLSPALARNLGVDQTRGAIINTVEKGGPADSAGLKAGDIVIAFNHAPVSRSSELRNRVGLVTPGESVTLTILRDAMQRDVTVKVSNAPETKTANAENTDQPRLEGATLESGRDGVRVTNVARNSPAWLAGLRPGDLITAINREPVTSPAEVERAFDKSAHQTALFVRRGEEDILIVF